jgi:hypothetical protein
MTSGKDGRFQIIYRIPPEFWESLKGRWVM